MGVRSHGPLACPGTDSLASDELQWDCDEVTAATSSFGKARANLENEGMSLDAEIGLCVLSLQLTRKVNTWRLLVSKMKYKQFLKTRHQHDDPPVKGEAITDNGTGKLHQVLGGLPGNK